MSDDLVKRLRRVGEGAYIGAVSEDRKAAQEAADRIKQLEAALREIASASKVVARKEDMAEALAVLFSSHKRIALTALEGKE